MVSEREKRERTRDARDTASLIISAASLGVGIAALCLNTRPEGATNIHEGERRMGTASRNEVSAEERLAKAKRERKEASKERKASRTEAGAAKQRQRALKASKEQQIRDYAKEIGYTGRIIMPNEKPVQSRSTKPSDMAWVAMEINRRTGERQAVVCNSMEEAEYRAVGMKKAHRKGSQKAKDCIQGYAKVDTSHPIDIRGCFFGGYPTYRVRPWPDARPLATGARSSQPVAATTGSP